MLLNVAVMQFKTVSKLLGMIGPSDLYTAVCLDENCLTAGWKCSSSRCAPAVGLKPCASALD